MRCLLVEDELERIERMLPELRKSFGDNIDIARDRDTAIRFTENVAYDLVVLDQRIPSSDGQLDAEVIHGRAVLDHVRQIAPYTPVYFLTGLPMEDEYLDRLIAEGMKADIWGARKNVSLNRRFQKATMKPFYEAVDEIAALARQTEEIEINTRGVPINLSNNEVRLLKIFTRLQGGICADVAILSGGLSGARIIRADIKDERGGVRMSVASKLGHHRSISDEIARYEQEVVRLRPGGYAPLIPVTIVQFGPTKGAFYRLLDGYGESLFEVLQKSDSDGAGCVNAIRDAEKPWSDSATTEKHRVADLLKLLVWEDRLPGIRSLLDGINWEPYEERAISVNMCTQHGDLHGENVLVNSDRLTMFIDYGAVGKLPSAIDAVTLELSPLFHPQGLRKLLLWKPGDGKIDWFDGDAFRAKLACPVYARAARDWAHAVSFGDREVLACAYIYLVRQLQFAGADTELARALLSEIVARGLNT